MSLLIALAGIITPLGLYDALVPIASVQITFQYLQDTSPFGLGTPSRSKLPFSRICGMDSPCPFSDAVYVQVATNNVSIVQLSYPYGYDTKVPKMIQEIYSSGTDQNTTVSNFFDIQWRMYYTSSNPTYDNGSAFLISRFQNMQSLVMNDEVQFVEGLIVDMVNASIGFRNHTFPPRFHYGVRWSEDLLFIEPETVCIKQNLTLDYTIAQSINSSNIITHLVLTDRGGFINLKESYPQPNITDLLQREQE
jgi:hypothetical protein